MKRFIIIFPSILFLIISFCSKEPEGPQESEELVFRNKPDSLSYDDVEEMMLKYDFYDKQYNPDGIGFENEFELQAMGLVVNDNNSGLMWQQNGSDEKLQFDEAESYISDLNNAKFAGYNNWRLPTLEEAMSLMEPTRESGLYLNPIFTKKQEWIWTSDQPEDFELYRFIVDFYNGCHGLAPFHFSTYVRAVRSM